MNTKRTAVLMLSAFLAVSCFKATVNREEVPMLSTSAVESKLSSDYGRDTVMVTSNRSWTVSTDTVSQWISIEPEEHINLSEVTESCPLVVYVRRNLSRNPRNYGFVIKGEGLSQSIKVIQEPADSESNISIYEPLEPLDTLKR